jgi:acyl-CoA reductase-like NAD-dependent aldehyde dehydrogenase
MDTYDKLLATITPASGLTRVILDPATGAVVGLAPVDTAGDLDRAVTAAGAAQPARAALGHAARSEMLNQVLPAGLLTVVSGDREIGARLSTHPDIGKVLFTGSTATGKAIIRSSADTVQRLTLELGGNDAGIVLPDVDPKAIAQDLFWGAFINTGQTCAALKRLYVHEDVYDAVCEELTAVAAAMPMGNGLDEKNVLGPLQNQAQFDIVSRLVESAKESGARGLIGGNPDLDQPGYFYPTTLIADIDGANPLVVEEQFGPALPIIRYTDLDAVIREANSVDVGLGGSKQSGYGLEFGVDGLKSLGVPQAISG